MRVCIHLRSVLFSADERILNEFFGDNFYFSIMRTFPSSVDTPIGHWIKSINFFRFRFAMQCVSDADRNHRRSVIFLAALRLQVI